jgi:hypothetical protein
MVHTYPKLNLALKRRTNVVGVFPNPHRVQALSATAGQAAERFDVTIAEALAHQTLRGTAASARAAARWLTEATQQFPWCGALSETCCAT